VTRLLTTHLIAYALFATVAASSAEAADRSWIFRRSYYSHSPVQPVELNRRLTGGPFYSGPVGDYVNAGYRWNRSSIVVGGRTQDHTNVFESWVQYGSQN
jgi:hypothetical protein